MLAKKVSVKWTCLPRFGGDEFVVLLPEADAHQARITAQRIRQALIDAPIDIGSEKISLTVSMGISSMSSDQDIAETILHRADQALYAARKLAEIASWSGTNYSFWNRNDRLY